MVENKWPSEQEKVLVADLDARFEANARERDRWLGTLSPQDAARVQTGVVSANFFDVLGIRPLLGRTSSWVAISVRRRR